MTISGILECSTCGHKIRLRHQVGYVYPVVVKVACNSCGKLLKGLAKEADPVFEFPNDKVTMGFEETTQIVSISSELPIALKVSNANGIAALTPFMGIGSTIGFENIKRFEKNVIAFLGLYDNKIEQLITCFELFENRNWEYYLIEAKKNFRTELNLDIITFDACSVVLKEINRDFFKGLDTIYYQTNFSQKLQTGTIDKVSSKINELKSLKSELETYINIESEFIKGVKLVEKFLTNIKSFFPVIVLSYLDDFTKEFKDDFGLSTFEFLDLKEMYIEQFEYLSRISSVYFGLINLVERSNIDDFGTIRDCSRLAEYFSKSNGTKKDIIKKHNFLNDYFLDTLNSQIRNGIGHFKTVYDPKPQLIKYYPYEDPAKINRHKEIYLVDFAFQVYQQSLKVRDSLELLSKFINLTNRF
ncbi:hypothetical protein [Marivirga sp.]|uniref:hypothetical protein n=1 Tax=Marivirga sp. TaxID=2018662 RepID=UPI003DA74309